MSYLREIDEITSIKDQYSGRWDAINPEYVAACEFKTNLKLV